ncbi:hypothetical protein [Natronomonas marina]|jgi:hypothetical protein|uniref:hypothetical protein n=1 Tax=Natronomonas marina TaxID=2961939 RepID=UPI0020C94FD6|nr:hypothetical protein [Natronomonas marina]
MTGIRGDERAPSDVRRGDRRGDERGTRGGTVADGGSHPSLESTLYGLSRADDAAAYARRHGLDVEEGTVAVEVRLAAGASAPEDRLETVGARFEDRLEATVAVDELLPLAEAPSVSYVDRPEVPHRHPDR